tara:strand:+ start:262 stop:768 length:507 start_codon:yes stop_codon:yes gene_type:complete
MRLFAALCATTASLLLSPINAGAEVEFKMDRFTGKKQINMHLGCEGIGQYSRGHDIPSCYLFSNGQGYRSIGFSISENDWVLLDSSDQGYVNAIFTFTDGTIKRDTMEWEWDGSVEDGYVWESNWFKHPYITSSLSSLKSIEWRSSIYEYIIRFDAKDVAELIKYELQ